VSFADDGTMSGFSPALLKFVMSGEMTAQDIVVDEDTGEVKVVTRNLTPSEMLEKIISDPGLDDLRLRLDEVVVC